MAEFSEMIPVARPTLEVGGALEADMKDVLASGQITNGRHVAEFEERVAEYLGVPSVVAVSSCTTGLLLLLRCLVDEGEVILPSWTFMASGHAVVWNGLDPVFADCAPDTFAVDAKSVSERMSERTGAVLAVHVFGSPCDVDALSRDVALPVVVDAAHGFGGVYPDGTMIGTKGVAEVFSLSPTKPLTAGEGGLIATRDRDLAARLRVAREYGNPGTYDSEFFGLNGRMTELSAVLGKANLVSLPFWLTRRRALAARYQENLKALPGISFQRVPEGGESTYKDMTLLVDRDALGLSRDGLAAALKEDGVDTRRYFAPPMHQQRAYRQACSTMAALPHTEALAERVLTVPLHSHMPEEVVDRVCEAIHRLHRHGPEVTAALGRV
ncbi:DegT/DnrJ/EryC1/StrS family aminotransferase [Streptomyces sp. NPDC098077]|uniref:DegT/DnrJ/EryC1/StrS family aminotransferase n=1 Tax=Streptomyces sp. NPDC098077 TaxID=3366093 RepID=UPI0038056B28